jgi:mannobiose 2-epimerase
MRTDLEALAREIESSLHTHVSSVWFPRCIDPLGGYLQNFGKDWTTESDPAKSLVFQSRMVWFTGQLATHSTDFRLYCEHGISHLVQTSDEKNLPSNEITEDGKSIANFRSAYSLAFATFGTSVAHLGTGSEASLRLAKSIFEYLEEFHADPNGRGYFEYTDLDGALIEPTQLKSQNPNLHLLEAYTSLLSAWENEKVRDRLRSLVDFFTIDLFSEPGFLHDSIDTQGVHGNGSVNFGHDLEVAHLLIAALEALGREDSFVIERAIRLVDHSLQLGWDDNLGGFWAGRTPSGQQRRFKVWWVQCEGLLALAKMFDLTGESRYVEALEKQWDWIRNFQIDSACAGVFATVGEDGKPFGSFQKGNAWKAAYHDGRAFYQTPAILRSILARSPQTSSSKCSE